MNKKIMGITLILLFGLMLFGCTSSSSNTTTGINTAQTTANSQLNQNVSCPKLLLPENFNVLSYGELNMLSDRNIFEEGYAFVETTDFECNRGANPGENTNYVYCKNMYVKKTDVDSQGNINGIIKYLVDFVYSTEFFESDGVQGNIAKLVQSSCKVVN